MILFNDKLVYKVWVWVIFGIIWRKEKEDLTYIVHVYLIPYITHGTLYGVQTICMKCSAIWCGDVGVLSSDQGSPLKLLSSDLAIYGWVSSMFSQFKNQSKIFSFSWNNDSGSWWFSDSLSREALHMEVNHTQWLRIDHTQLLVG